MAATDKQTSLRAQNGHKQSALIGLPSWTQTSFGANGTRSGRSSPVGLIDRLLPLRRLAVCGTVAGQVGISLAILALSAKLIFLTRLSWTSGVMTIKF
jgi:hypothetical protein